MCSSDLQRGDDDLPRGAVGCFDERAQLDAEGDGALLHHAGELAPTNDCDDWTICAHPIHGANLSRPPLLGATVRLEAAGPAPHGHDRPLGHYPIGVEGGGDCSEGDREYRRVVVRQFEAPSHGSGQVFGEGEEIGRAHV